MAKADYAPRRRTTRKKTSPLPGWAWMLIGLLVGLFVAFLVFLHKTPPSSEGARPEPETPPPAAPETKKKEGLQFDFYKLLPEMEVAIPPEEVVPPAHDREPVNYYLQAGSFRDSADADGRKAELALLGLEATIQTVTINGTGHLAPDPPRSLSGDHGPRPGAAKAPGEWLRVYVDPGENRDPMRPFCSGIRTGHEIV